jgi:hypothetical protein
MEPSEFKVGQIWLSRDGHIQHTIISVNGQQPFPIITDKGFFTETGHFWVAGPRSSNQDLTKLIKDTSTKEFKIGQIWERRDGTYVRITGLNKNTYLPVMTSSGISYYENGKYHSNGNPSPYDLMSPIESTAQGSSLWPEIPYKPHRETVVSEIPYKPTRTCI